MESPLHGTRGRNAHRALPGCARSPWRECSACQCRDHTCPAASTHQGPFPGSTKSLAGGADPYHTAGRELGARGRADNGQNTADHPPQPRRCLGSRRGCVARTGGRLGLVAPCGSRCGSPLVLSDVRSRSDATASRARRAGRSCGLYSRTVSHARSTLVSCKRVGRARRGTRPRRSKQDRQTQRSWRAI